MIEVKNLVFGYGKKKNFHKEEEIGSISLD